MKKYTEYKESYHSWEKEIPSNWTLTKLQYCFSVLTDFTANGSFASLAENVKYLDKPDYSRLVRLTDLRENLENDGVWINKDAHDFLSKSELFGCELVLANVGAYTGFVCKIPEIKGKASLGPNMFLLKFTDDLISNFMYYALCSYFGNEQLKLFATATAQPKLNKDNTKSDFPRI
jgi:type I restriction enzyme S subunit